LTGGRQRILLVLGAPSAHQAALLRGRDLLETIPIERTRIGSRTVGSAFVEKMKAKHLTWIIVAVFVIIMVAGSIAVYLANPHCYHC